MVAGLVLVLVVGAWALERKGDSAQSGGYSIAVIKGGRTVDTFTLDQLKQLESRRVRMQGQWEQGPSVLSVLHEAGIDRFKTVTFVGANVVSSGASGGTLTLRRAEVDEDVILDIATRGTAKACGPEIPRNSRIRDVVRIEVAE